MTSSTPTSSSTRSSSRPSSKPTNRILFALLGSTLSLTALAATSSEPQLVEYNQVDHSQINTTDLSPDLVWETASLGDDGGIADLLTPSTWESIGDDEFTDALALLQTNLDKREATRAESIETARAALTEHLTKFDDTGSLIELSKALIEAVALELLYENKDQFYADKQISRLIDEAIKGARQAEANRDWLIASELFFRLNTLHDQDGTFKEDVDRLTRRLTMIRLYVPERLWELRNERRLAEDLEGLPPYNSYGDLFTDKLQGIDSITVRTALQRSAAQHMGRLSRTNTNGISMNQLIVGGLGAVRTMATTTDLAGAFEGFANEQARTEFITELDALSERFKNQFKPASAYDLRRAIDTMLTASRDTVKVMPEALLHEFGNGSMAQLDDYTAIIWPDEVARFTRSTKGEFFGVGIRIQLDELQNITIATPLAGTPAQRAGLQADDVIKKVDGISAVGLGLDQAVEVITGPPNTDVTLTVERKTETDDGTETIQELEYTVTRAKIDLPSVKGWSKTGPGNDEWDYFVDRDEGIGYIRLTGFTQDTTNHFDRAVASMKQTGLKALVLDLRYNPGGLLDQAVKLSSRFVPEGLVVKTVDAAGIIQDNQNVRAVNPKHSVRDIPVIVLVNEGSASASEIVSGAIQAGARNGKNKALVVGARSFGKGSVQNVYMLPGGLAAMKLTTQHYQIDAPRMIHKTPGATEWGIEPDLHVEMLPSQQAAAVLLRRDSDIYPIDQDGNYINNDERPDPNTLITDGIDLQMQTALVLLKSQVDESVVKTTMND